MYKVIRFFTDLQDGKHAYNVGDTFPREGITVSDERIAILASKANRQGVPLIKEVATGNVVHNPVLTPAQPEEVVQEPTPKKVTRQATKKDSGTQPKKRTATKKKD